MRYETTHFTNKENAEIERNSAALDGLAKHLQSKFHEQARYALLDGRRAAVQSAGDDLAKALAALAEGDVQRAIRRYRLAMAVIT